MTPEPIDQVSPGQRVLAYLLRGLRKVVFRGRMALAALVQVVQRDQIQELSVEAKNLGSAASESISYVGTELREINDRLSTLERDLERVTRLLEDRAGGHDTDPRAEPSAQSLSSS